MFLFVTFASRCPDVARLAGIRTSTISPEEFALNKLMEEWNTLGEDEDGREQFFDKLVGVYNADNFSEETTERCRETLDQGVVEEQVVVIMIPDDIGDDELVTEAEFMRIGQRVIVRRLELYSGVAPYLNREELLLDSIEEMPGETPDFLLEFIGERRHLIADFREGRVDETEAKRRITSVQPMFLKILLEQPRESDLPQGMYVSRSDLEHAWELE